METKEIPIIEIVKQWLKCHGYEGLCNPDVECGCGLDDLMPCGGCNEYNCLAAYKVPVPKQYEGQCDSWYSLEKAEKLAGVMGDE